MDDGGSDERQRYPTERTVRRAPADGASIAGRAAATRARSRPACEPCTRAIRADVRTLYGSCARSTTSSTRTLPGAGAPGGGRALGARAPADSPETRTLSRPRGRHPLLRDSCSNSARGCATTCAREHRRTKRTLERYCQQAGGSVGSMLAALLGATSPDRGASRGWPRSAGRCSATNILRDIDEDARTRAPLHRPATIERFGARLPARAGGADARSDRPRRCAVRAGSARDRMLAAGREAMALSAALYREILRQIERDGYGREAGRAIVPRCGAGGC